MKSSALIPLLFFFTTAFSANHVPEAETLDCRKYVKALDLHFSAALLIHQDLIHGIWTAETEAGTKKVFQFTDYGLADMLFTDANGKTDYQNALWRVEDVRGQTYLILTGNDMRLESYFNLKQTCEGIVLTNLMTKEELNLLYKPLAEYVNFNKVKENLVGEWTNVTYPFDVVSDIQKCGTFEQMKGAFLRYTFNANGTYSCVYGSDMMKMEENGRWEVSADGNFLIFHATENGGPDHIKETKVAILKQVDEHSMMLEHPFVTHDFTEFFCTEKKTFAFVK